MMMMCISQHGLGIPSTQSTQFCAGQPTGTKMPGGSHKEVSLVYFSTFEPIKLTPGSVMQRAGVTMLYDSAKNPQLPCLYTYYSAFLQG
jgi:hypothetical protein